MFRAVDARDLPARVVCHCAVKKQSSKSRPPDPAAAATQACNHPLLVPRAGGQPRLHSPPTDPAAVKAAARLPQDLRAALLAMLEVRKGVLGGHVCMRVGKGAASAWAGCCCSCRRPGGLWCVHTLLLLKEPSCRGGPHDLCKCFDDAPLVLPPLQGEPKVCVLCGDLPESPVVSGEGRPCLGPASSCRLAPFEWGRVLPSRTLLVLT